jgi:hypothetical protein
MEQVIADEMAPRAEHAYRLGHCALPVDDVVEHREGQHGVELAIGKRKGRGVDALGAPSLTEGCQPPGGGADHVVVVIGGRQAQLGKLAQELGGHGSTPTADLERLTSQAHTLERPRQQHPAGERPVWEAGAHDLGKGRHLRHHDYPVMVVRIAGRAAIINAI